jgi:hypothetical protein
VRTAAVAWVRVRLVACVDMQFDTPPLARGAVGLPTAAPCEPRARR